MRKDAALAKVIFQETTVVGDQKEVRILYECESILYMVITKSMPGRRIEVARAATIEDHVRATKAKIEQQETRRIH